MIGRGVGGACMPGTCRWHCLLTCAWHLVSMVQEEGRGRKLSKKELAKKLRSGTTSKSS